MVIYGFIFVIFVWFNDRVFGYNGRDGGGCKGDWGVGDVIFGLC